MTWERINELINNNNRTDIEEEELEILRADRCGQQSKMIVRPTCCEAAQNYPIVSFIAHNPEDGSLAEGSWEANINYKFSSLFDNYRNYENKPSVKFCSYCGKKLPNMVLTKKDVSKKHICKITDGGYYCDTCNQRLDSCFCDPQETLFEPEEK
jgi:hypothetical protein